jgi:hypothetical protein
MYWTLLISHVVSTSFRVRHIASYLEAVALVFNAVYVLEDKSNNYVRKIKMNYTCRYEENMCFAFFSCMSCYSWNVITPSEALSTDRRKGQQKINIGTDRPVHQWTNSIGAQQSQMKTWIHNDKASSTLVTSIHEHLALTRCPILLKHLIFWPVRNTKKS